MARLGEYIQEESHPVGEDGGCGLNMIGVSNERGLEISSRNTSANISRYIEVRRDWFAYNPMRINVGSIGLADDDSKIGYTSPDYTVFSCKEGLLPEYLLRFLKSEYGIEAIVRHSSGAVRKRLYFSGLSEIELEIPSVEEQEKSIDRFRTVEEATRCILKENSDTLEIPQLKQAILQEAIEGKLTADWRAENTDVEPASELLQRIQAEKAQLIKEKKIRKEKKLPEITSKETPFEIPDSWEWCHLLDSSLQIHYGFTASADFTRNDIRFVRITDIQDGKVDWPAVPGCLCSQKEFSKYQLNNGDLLIARTGGTVGKSYMVSSLAEDAVFASYLVRIVPGTQRLARYLSLFFGSFSYWGQIVDAAKGAQPNVSGTKLKRLILPLPPVAEQAIIVERVEALMATCRELEAEIERSRTHAAELLQAVLKEAFAPTSS